MKIVKQVVYNEQVLIDELGERAITDLPALDGYFFTEEELRQLLSEYTGRIVESAKIDYASFFFKDGEKCVFKADTFVNKRSITDQLEVFLKDKLYE